MFTVTNHLTPCEREILHAAQDLIIEGLEPTSGRIAKLCPTVHVPTVVTTRNRLRRRGLIKIAPVLRVYVEPERKKEDDLEIVSLSRKSALDRICNMTDVDRRGTCATILKIWRESFSEAV